MCGDRSLCCGTCRQSVSVNETLNPDCNDSVCTLEQKIAHLSDISPQNHLDYIPFLSRSKQILLNYLQIIYVISFSFQSPFYCQIYSWKVLYHILKVQCSTKSRDCKEALWIKQHFLYFFRTVNIFFTDLVLYKQLLELSSFKNPQSDVSGAQ